MSHRIWQMLWRWAYRRHAHRKSRGWVKRRYFMCYRGRDWTFYAHDPHGNLITIFQASEVPIQRHLKIRDRANPYDPQDETYFEQRKDYLMANKLAGKRMISYLYRRQKGLCPHCQQKITEQTGWNAHHLIPKHLGGKWESENLVLMHPVCHVQVHQQPVTPDSHRGRVGLNGWR